jgi:hypothetical protein
MLLESDIGARRAVGFGDHAKVTLVFQDAAVALSDDRVVVDQQN